MLFQVHMDVRLPHDLPAERADALKNTERERAQALQRTHLDVIGNPGLTSSRPYNLQFQWWLRGGNTNLPF